MDTFTQYTTYRGVPVLAYALPSDETEKKIYEEIYKNHIDNRYNIVQVIGCESYKTIEMQPMEDIQNLQKDKDYEIITVPVNDAICHIAVYKPSGFHCTEKDIRVAIMDWTQPVTMDRDTDNFYIV